MKTAAKIASVLALCASLAGCAYGHDEFGNELPPPDAVPHGWTYDKVVVWPAKDGLTLWDWCRKYKGVATGDRQGCIVHFDTVVGSHPCYEGIVTGLAPKRRASVKRELDDVCNGWYPAT